MYTFIHTYIHEQTLWAECRACLMLEQVVDIVTTVTSGSYSARGCRFVASTRVQARPYFDRAVFVE